MQRSSIKRFKHFSTCANRYERRKYDRLVRVSSVLQSGSVFTTGEGKMNFVTEKEGTCSAVLIRGAEPVENIELMSLNRYKKPYNELSKYQVKNLLNGPGKLCNALNIAKEHNGTDLTGNEIYVEDDGFSDFIVEKSKRINIDYAEEARDFLWRYTMLKNS